MNPSLIVFDWDGTLRDSVASIVGCALAALGDLGRDTEPQAIRATIGLGLDTAVRRWVPGIEPPEVSQVIERYRLHWVATWHERASLFPGVPSLLEQLSARGCLLAIATGKSRAGLRRDLEASDPETRSVARFFHATRTADETAAKPSPQMLFELMSELGAQPAETLMVGDTDHDLNMAKSAAVAAVAVLGTMSRVELEPLAVGCIESVTELTAWLEGVAALSGEAAASRIAGPTLR